MTIVSVPEAGSTVKDAGRAPGDTCPTVAAVPVTDDSGCGDLSFETVELSAVAETILVDMPDATTRVDSGLSEVSDLSLVKAEAREATEPVTAGVYWEISRVDNGVNESIDGVLPLNVEFSVAVD